MASGVTVPTEDARNLNAAFERWIHVRGRPSSHYLPPLPSASESSDLKESTGLLSVTRQPTTNPTEASV